jgi:outer membrane protein
MPTLDLTANYASNRFNSNGAPSNSRVNNNTASIGLVFNMSLYAGNATQNRIKETVALQDKARFELEAAQRSVSQATRTAFYGVQSGLGQVKALEAAEASSQSALDANKLGYQVGVRINIDVLNSQSQLFQTKRDLAKARHDVLLGFLRLRQAAGVLKASDLEQLGAMFQQ